MEAQRDFGEHRQWLRDEIADKVQDGGTLLFAAEEVTLEELDLWVTDVHNYFEETSDWIDDNLGFAECIRFRDLHGPKPKLSRYQIAPLNEQHGAHIENLERRLHNLREIMKDYPPLVGG